MTKATFSPTIGEMGFKIEFKNLEYGVKSHPDILKNINFQIEAGQFVAVLGENGAGKTSMLDLMMGFRKPTNGAVLFQNEIPFNDPWKLRDEIAYLSEKSDIPGDWSVKEFLEFNKYFYSNYSSQLEEDFCERFRVKLTNRLGNMSAGEIRRVQIVGALSIRPKAIVVDEITAVLDIVGRRHFMRVLSELNRKMGCTIVLATNILEDLENHVSHVLLLNHGRVKLFKELTDFLDGKEKSHFPQMVADILENE